MVRVGISNQVYSLKASFFTILCCLPYPHKEVVIRIDCHQECENVQELKRCQFPFISFLSNLASLFMFQLPKVYKEVKCFSILIIIRKGQMMCYIIYHEIFLCLFVFFFFYFLAKLMFYPIQGQPGRNNNERKYSIPSESIFILLSLFAEKAAPPHTHIHGVLGSKTDFLIFQKLLN